MPTNDDIVLLVHGFASHRAVMWPLSLRLQSFGFRAVSWSYASLFSPIDAHATRLRAFCTSQFSNEPRFHVVAHSMGAIVTRVALDSAPLPNLGRIVLLAPPNKGSPIARIASRFLANILVPTRELSDQPTSFVNRLSNSGDLEVGIIAAKFDLLVPVQNTHLPSERSHKTRFATHNSLLLSRKASIDIANFLRTGSFQLVP